MRMRRFSGKGLVMGRPMPLPLPVNIRLRTRLPDSLQSVSPAAAAWESACKRA